MKRGYCIVLLDVANQSLYAEYARRATEIEARHGGRALAVADAVNVMEGVWPSQRVVVLEFPSLEAAHQWYADPEYAELIPLRQEATKSAILIVEGFEEAE